MREDADLSQVELAERLGATQSYIGKCERGERRLDFVEVQAFCKALGVPMTELVQQFEHAQGLTRDQLLEFFGEEWP